MGSLGGENHVNEEKVYVNALSFFFCILAFNTSFSCNLTITKEKNKLKVIHNYSFLFFSFVCSRRKITAIYFEHRWNFRTPVTRCEVTVALNFPER